MVELQLEKLSPLPVAQIVWTAEILPKTPENLQPVIVVITARDLVEQFLGSPGGRRLPGRSAGNPLPPSIARA